MARTQVATQADAAQQRNTAITNTFVADLDAYTPNIRDALPAHIPVERFKRVVVMAVSQNPDLLYANRRSLFTACQRCAVDGLYPDGREAALVVYNTRVKQRDPDTGNDREVRMDLVQYMPMIAGIRKRLRNSGEVAKFTAEAVFAKDDFSYRLGDDAFIHHQPPSLGQDRGDVVGSYAIITLTNGEVIRDVMDRAAIEKARHQGRAPNSLMWDKFYWEGAKKTVARRAAKQAPLSPDLERLLSRDEEHPFTEHAGDGHLPEVLDHDVQRRPEPEQQIEHRGTAPIPPEDTGPQYAVVDLDGVESVFANGGRAYDALRALLAEAERHGADRLDGFWESNQPTIELLSSSGFADQVVDLATAFDQARQRAKARPTGAAAPAQREPAATSTTPAPAAGPSSTGDARPAAAAVQQPEAPAATQVAPEPEQARSAPPGATAQPANDGADAVDEAGRPSLMISMVVKQGKPDCRTWVVALFLPKLRRQRDSRTLAFLLGDNDENLELVRRPGNLPKDDLDELNAAIDHQWKLVENG